MISTWRRRREARKGTKKQDLEKHSTMELAIPNHFRCPISLELMKDPVTLSTGITYDRESIETWIEAGNNTCPVTNQVERCLEPIPNHTIRKMIQDWCVENKKYGIERIPTPRVPITSGDVWEIFAKVEATMVQNDAEGCLELVLRIKALVKESERNKRCIVDNGIPKVLGAAFEAFSKGSFENKIVVLEEILSALTVMLSFDDEVRSYLGSASSLGCMVWFLKSGDLSGQRNAVLVLGEVISSDQKKIDCFVEIEGAMEALFQLIKEPISPTTTKASLMAIHRIISSSSPTGEKVMSRLISMGLVAMLFEILVDSDKSTCEKVLAVVDEICSFDQGREMAYSHALTMPVLVKKILRVSDLATHLSVSILCKLLKNDKREDGGVLVEGLQLGAFQKLLLLLQVGCCEKTKDNATELLKLMNLHREKLECIDSADFKHLRRSS